MKKIIFATVLLLMASSCLFAQKNTKPYFYFAPGIFIKSNKGSFYPTVGFGYFNKKNNIGIGLSGYHQSSLGVTAHLDFYAGIPNDSKGSVFYIFVQPGKSFYNKSYGSPSYIKTTGGLSFNAGIGIFGSKKREGAAPFIRIGYTTTSINTTTNYPGAQPESSSASANGGFVTIGFKL